MKQNEKTPNWIFKPFIGKNYNKSVVGKLKILVIGDIYTLWEKYDYSEAKNSQKISFCEYLMKSKSAQCIRYQTKIKDGIKDELKNILGKNEIKLDDIIFYNFRFNNREKIPCTNEQKWERYCGNFLECLKKQKPTIVFGFQNFITQLESRAVNGWKSINDYLEKIVVKEYYNKNYNKLIIPIHLKDNSKEKRNIGNHGLNKLKFINDTIKECVDFLQAHCLFSSLEKQVDNENKYKEIRRNFRTLDFMPTIKEENFKFFTTDSIKISREEFINAYNCVHGIKKQINELNEEIKFIRGNANKKTVERNKIDDEIEQIKKMLTFLETEDFYIDIELVPSFMDYAGKKFPLEPDEKIENVVSKFLDDKNTKPSLNVRSVKKRLTNICKRLQKEKDEVYLKRMYRIIQKQTPSIYKKIYAKKDYEIIQDQVKHFDPDKILI